MNEESLMYCRQEVGSILRHMLLKFSTEGIISNLSSDSAIRLSDQIETLKQIIREYADERFFDE